MSSDNNLPILLVSGRDNAAVDYIISEMCGPELQTDATGARVWAVRNKYYTARVRLEPDPDPAAAADPAAADPDPDPAAPAPAHALAHLVYLAAGEDAPALRARASRARARLAADAERVAAAAGGGAGGAEGAAGDAALALGYERVPLDAPDDPDDADSWGLRRVREALQARAWPGLHRAAGAGAAGAGAGAAGAGAGAGAGDEGDVCALLAALGAARGEGAAERRRRAMPVLRAAAAALGLTDDLRELCDMPDLE